MRPEIQDDEQERTENRKKQYKAQEKANMKDATGVIDRKRKSNISEYP